MDFDDEKKSLWYSRFPLSSQYKISRTCTTLNRHSDCLPENSFNINIAQTEQLGIERWNLQLKSFTVDFLPALVNYLLFHLYDHLKNWH